MLTSRERVLAQLHLKETDRIPLLDNPWFTTLERWRNEGMPPDVSTAEYFDFDMLGFAVNGSLMLEEKVVEETDEYKITTNKNGATMKNWKHKTSTPELIGFSITTPEKWEEVKHNLYFKEDCLKDTTDYKHLYDKAKKEEKFVYVSFPMGYDELSGVVGPEVLLPAMLTEPEWVSDMFCRYMDLKIACVEELLVRGYEFDGAFVYDDLGYKNGVFFSSEIYKNILFPQHKKICDFLHSKGWKVILHSCGNVKQHIPALIEAGFNCLQPLEVKAGMDVVEIKKEYGDVLAFMGGIDVRAMANPNPAVIEEEIKTKISFAKKGGGYIYHSDHSVPDDVSFEQYKRVIELVHKYGKY